MSELKPYRPLRKGQTLECAMTLWALLRFLWLCREQRRGHGTSCWAWKGMLDADGYPQFKVEGKKQKAHRVAWTWFRGPIPEGLDIDHQCKNRDCVNPLHLRPLPPEINRDTSQELPPF